MELLRLLPVPAPAPTISSLAPLGPPEHVHSIFSSGLPDSTRPEDDSADPFLPEDCLSGARPRQQINRLPLQLPRPVDGWLDS